MTIRPFLLPLSKQRRARLELQLARQQRYREHLEQKKAPRRSDFASISVEFVLTLVARDPYSEISQDVSAGIVNGLVEAGFDREQSVIRFKQMIDRLGEYRERRTHYRDFDAKRRAAEKAAEGEAASESKAAAEAGAVSK